VVGQHVLWFLRDPGRYKSGSGITGSATLETVPFSVWPWESVRNKLRDALTEICVASDVLAIATKVIYFTSLVCYINLLLVP
jgi:hypothetical protein